MSYESQGAGYDPGAAGYERQGRATASVDAGEKPIRITGTQAAEFGPGFLTLAKDLIKQVFEERTGKPHEWLQEINVDAIVLRPVPECGPDPERPWGRIDFYPGHTLAQFLPGQCERMIVELTGVADSLRNGHQRQVSFVQIAEVETVKE